jgi:amino acid adenylation domain-containing protein
MDIQTMFPELPESRSLAWEDLFASRSGLGAGPRLAATLPLPIDAARHPASAHRFPDAPWAAAWVLLQSRWLGQPAPVLQEVASADDAFASSFAWDAAPTAGEWIAAIDRQRGEASAMPLPAELPAVLWLRDAVNAIDAAAAPAPIRLRFSAQPPCLHADASAGWLDAISLQQLLAAVADTAADLLSRPDAPIAEIRGLPQADRERQLAEWNRPVAPLDRALTVTGRFRAQAAAVPDAIALVQGQARLSYRELDRRSDALAQGLQQRGVQAGDAVALVLERSIDAVVAQLAILKAGAAYLPIPTEQPRERIAAMLAQAGARLAITTEAFDALLPPSTPPLRVNACADDGPRGSWREPDVDGESLAYLMYTSGSTGTPKGIAICHRAILRLVVGSDFAAFGHGLSMLHAAPLGFDAATLEIWGPLLNGGCCVVHDERLPTGAGLARTIARHGVHTAWLTAALFNAVVDDDPAHLAGLRHLITGGEALSLPHVRRALAALPALMLSNGYGPTECTTFAATHRIPAVLPDTLRSVPLGRPIQDTVLRVLSPSLALLPAGLVGELCIGGHGLARGYLGQPALSAQRFVADPFGAAGDRLYRSGDLARWLPDGTIEFVGRRDGQVKIHGHRVELGEIETALLSHPAIQSCAVAARPDAGGALRLVAYLVARAQPLPWEALRAHLAARLPAALLPSAQLWLPRLPLTPNGKLDRQALPEPAGERPALAQAYEVPRDAAEQAVCEAFAHVLQLAEVGRHDNFFDLGGDSMRVLQVLAVLQRDQRDQRAPLSTNLFFSHPTPAAIAARLRPGGKAKARAAIEAPRERAVAAGADVDAIALIGTAGRFPGAADVEQFWDNLVAGRDSISFFDDATLDAGVSEALRRDPAYVRARGVIDGIEDFDAAFFGIAPKEAALMDPQQRVFLEICWECLERAGYVPDAAPGPVGVYAGMYNASYAQRHLSTRPDLVEAVGEFQTMLANEKDYIATRVAHRLNLTGPAVSVHTACSTSLVAVAQAFHALRSGQCYMALAGGAAVTCPPRSGYLYNEGAMLSPDGHTRSFDAKAQGTVFSDGAAVVLLKRLADAQADGDTIHAVLRSACVNNDGGAKASFTAPSVDGQAAVIRAALAAARVDARSISFVEAHGTATPMGDPIEVEALASAFAEHTDALDFCTLGSLKSNVGHMVTAAGAAGLIKTALALQHECIPPTAHFSEPHPAIGFERTPFRVNPDPKPWPRGAQPRRAGVSSFGVGGTNAHVIVEEAPARAPSAPDEGMHVLPLAARSEAALALATERLAAHLETHPEDSLADVAHTLAVGRKAHAFRRVVVAARAHDAVAALRDPGSPWRANGSVGARVPQLVLMFPGQGAQYAGMGRALHGGDPVFAAAFDDTLAAFAGELDFDLRERMFSSDPQALLPTSVAQPALFTLEYALARRLLSLGARPQLLIGHSVGEFVAAVLAGVMRLEDAARLVARRGALMQAQPAGAMLSVRLGAAELLARLDPSLSLAADNGPTACVAAGPSEAIAALQASLQREDIASRALQTSHAFHSSMMDEVVAPFEALVRQVVLRAPRIPIVSTLTGQPLGEVEATSAAYWAQHVRGTVRFSPALRDTLARLSQPLFVETGPRNTLATLARQHAGTAVSLLHGDPADEVALLRLACARLWTCGAEIELARLSTRTDARRVRLPTTPFERQRCWVDIAPPLSASATVATPAAAPLVPPIALESTVTVATPPPLPSASTLDARLRALFEDICGLDMAQADGHAPFAELGLDSLTLTQAATQIRKHFKVELSFRQLMEKHRSFDALAAFLRQSLPDEAPSAAAMPVMPAMAVPRLDENAGAFQLPQLIAQQMEIMRQQLALLSGAASVAPASVAVPQATAEAGPTATPPQRYDVAKAFGAIARIHTQRTAEPSARQQARLAAFVRRYVERTRRSKQFTEDNRPHMADPRVVTGFNPLYKDLVYPIVVNRSQGANLWDLDGNEYIDLLSCFGGNLLGYQPPKVIEAMQQQLQLGLEVGPQHPYAADVAQLISEFTGMERVGFCNTGSEAVMGAMRIARTVTGRKTIAIFTNSYHGIFDEVIVRGTRQLRSLSAAPGILANAVENILVLDWNSEDSLRVLRERGPELAAIMTEPIQNKYPTLQPLEFVQSLRQIADKAGCALIFDEVVTGFRVAPGGAQEFYGVRADIATYGKVIGGGLPFAAIAGNANWLDALDGGHWQYGDDSYPEAGVTYFAGTFVRHPLALAAAKAALMHLKEAGAALQEGLNQRTGAMADELSAWCLEVGAPIAIGRCGSLWRVHWLEEHPLQDLLFAMMRSRGIHILDNFPCFLTSAHGAQDIAAIQAAFKASVAELQESDFLPRRAPSPLSFEVRRNAQDGSVLARDVDGQPFWYVPVADGGAVPAVTDPAPAGGANAKAVA